MTDDHSPQEKHLQLGVELDEEGNPIGDDRTMLEDEADIDGVWADVTTVEQFKEDIELLARESGQT